MILDQDKLREIVQDLNSAAGECLTMIGDGMRVINKYSQGIKLAVELGTYKGCSATIMSLDAERVVTIDCFEDFFTIIENERAYIHYSSLWDKEPRFYKDIVKPLRARKNISIRKGPTWKVPLDCRNVGLLFIDGDHTYPGVSKDFYAWIEYVAIGGYIIFDDYDKIDCGVREFVDNEIKPRKDMLFIEQAEIQIVFQKVG